MKKLKGLLVAALTLVMAFGMVITADAGFSVYNDVTSIKAVDKSPVTVDVNDANATITFSVAGAKTANDVRVQSNNGSIVRIASKELKSNTLTVKLAPQTNGTAKITVSSKKNAKVKAVTTVKLTTAAKNADIAFGSNVSNNTITIAAGGKLNLGATLTGASANASVKTLKYESADTKTVKVSGKGDVTVDKKAAAGTKVVVKVATQTSYKVGKVMPADAKTVTVVVASQSTNKLTLKTSAGKTSAKLSSNGTVSSDKLALTGYSVDAVTFTSSNPAVATVDEFGFVKAVAAGKANIVATAKDNASKTAKVAVTVTTDTTRVTLKSVGNDADVYNNGKDSITLKVGANAGGSTKVKYAVALVNGKTVTPTKEVKVNGKGVLTASAKAAAGTYRVTATSTVKNSTAKATFDVQVLASTTDFTATPVKTALVVNTATEADTETVVTTSVAATAKSANTKVVDVFSTDGKTFTVYANAKGTAKVTFTVAENGSKVKKDIKFTVTDAGVLATDVEVYENEIVMAGDATQYVNAYAAKRVYDKSSSQLVPVYGGKLVYTVDAASKKNITVDKNGKITAKATNQKSTLKVAVADAKGKAIAGTEQTVTVYTGDKIAPLKKALDSKISSEIKAEKRDYTGAKFSYKNGNFTITVTNPQLRGGDLKNTGITDVLEAVLTTDDKEIDYISIFDLTGDKDYMVTNTDGGLYINGDKSSINDVNGIVDFLKNEVVGAEKQLKYWAGSQYYIQVGKKELVKFGNEYKSIPYTFYYSANVALTDKQFDTFTDEDIADAIKAIKLPNATVTFDPKTNYITVTENSRDDKLAAVFDADTEAVVYAILTALDACDVTNINYSIDVNGLTKPMNADGYPSDEGVVNFVVAMKEALLGVFGNDATIDDVNGTVIDATFSFALGYKTLERDYHIELKVDLDKEAADKAADKAIVEGLAANKAALASVADVTYDTSLNTFDVKLNLDAEDKTIVDAATLGDTNVVSVVAGIAAKANIAENQTFKLTVDDQTVAVKYVADPIAAVDSVKAALAELKLKNVVDLANKTATVDVILVNSNKDVTLTYTVNFTDGAEKVAKDSIDKATAAVIEKYKSLFTEGTVAFDAETGTFKVAFNSAAALKDIVELGDADTIINAINEICAGSTIGKDSKMYIYTKNFYEEPIVVEYKASGNFETIKNTLAKLGVEKVADLDGKNFAVAVESKIGAANRVVETIYGIQFTVETPEKVADKKADEVIDKTIEAEADKLKEVGTVKYDADSNTMAVTFASNVKDTDSVKDLADADVVLDIAEKLVGDANVVVEEGVKVSFNGKEQTFKVTSALDAPDEILKALDDLGIKTVADLKGKKIDATVVQESNGTKADVAYILQF